MGIVRTAAQHKQQRAPCGQGWQGPGSEGRSRPAGSTEQQRHRCTRQHCRGGIPPVCMHFDVSCCAMGRKTSLASLSTRTASAVQALAVASMPGSPIEEVVAGRQASTYLPDAAALASAGTAAWAFMPQSAQSLLVQALLGGQPGTGVGLGDRDAHAAGCEAGRGVLLLWSDRPRALSQRERLWAAAVAAKLHDVPGAESNAVLKH